MLVLSLLLALAATAQPRPMAEIPFEFAGHHTFIDVAFGEQTLSFVFDTGAAGVGINEVTARRLGIEATDSGAATGAGGTVQLPVARGLALRIGALELDGITAALLPVDHLEEVLGRPLDGIIGRDLMRGHVVVLDHERNVIGVHRRRGFPFDVWGKPCTLQGGATPSVTGRLRLLDGETLPGSFLIDSGAGLFVSLNSPFVDDHDLAGRTGTTYARTGRALTGVPIADRIGRIASLIFCGHELPTRGTAVTEAIAGFPVGLSGAKAGVQAGRNSAGLIGNAVLRRFNIAIDIDRGKMYLKPNRHWDDPIRTDASGLFLIRRPDGAVLIDAVVPGSPGALAGLAGGDRLSSIDDADTATLTLAESRRRFEEHGKSFKLGIVRDGRAMSVVLESRSLFTPPR